MIAGPQTAIVVGASGNEIETDKHGRIKIQFPWDRLGKKDKNSSCWVRVAQPWAGKGYGMFGLPRVGHEVVVQFLNGDPDRPIVIGSVYNNDNMPAWKLPERVDGQRLQEPQQRQAATRPPPTSCASTTRRTASTSGSTPRGTSTAWSSTTRSTGSATTSRSRWRSRARR